MEVSDYLNQPGLDKLIQEARFIRSSGKKFSDLRDESGLQYVDLVLEAQGITFMSLLGYTFILEEAGLGFFNVAGVSSGALNAMIVAALGQQQYKSIYILKALNKFSYGRHSSLSSQNRSTNFMKKVSQLRNHLFPNQTKTNTLDKEKKRQWLTSVFSELGLTSLQELNQATGQKPNGLKHIFGGNISDLSPRLAIITSDITTHTKVELPKMAALYWDAPENVSPVELILASMAIPYFHTPYTIDNIPSAGTQQQHNWIEQANFHEQVPQKIRFMDGSMIYQPPFNIFHRTDQVTPRMPTFGASVAINTSETDSLNGFTSSLINTTKKDVLSGFLESNPDCKSLMSAIEIDGRTDWLNFNISDKEKMSLFREGVKAGLEFLVDFDWQQYKSMRNEGLSHRFCSPYVNSRVAS